MTASDYLIFGLGLMIGSIPGSIGIGIALWAMGFKFPQALLVTIIMIPAMYFTGAWMLTEKNAMDAQYLQEHPVNYNVGGMPGRGGVNSKRSAVGPKEYVAP